MRRKVPPIDEWLTPPSPEDYTKPFLEFIGDNPTAWHVVQSTATRLEEHGFLKLSERDLWNAALVTLQRGGKYYAERNGSALIAFIIGDKFETKNGAALVTGHIDACGARLKPVSKLPDVGGFARLAIAPYAESPNPSWLDRDLSIAGRVMVKDAKSGKVESRLLDLRRPIACIPGPTIKPFPRPTLPYNLETTMVPITGIDSREDCKSTEFEVSPAGKDFISRQPSDLVMAIAQSLGIEDARSIVNWELELYDSQAPVLGGLNNDLIFAGRLDDKLCSFAALEALLLSDAKTESGILKGVILLDNEEIGGPLRQGSSGNFTQSVMSRVCEAFRSGYCTPKMDLAQMYAKSFLVCFDITHAINPNWLSVVLEDHWPMLNIGPAICQSSTGAVTGDQISTALIQSIAKVCGSKLQIFQVRNDNPGGGTDGPVMSSQMGMRAANLGIPQLSAHSIRSTTGSLDPGFGVILCKGFFDHYEAVNVMYAETE